MTCEDNIHAIYINDDNYLKIVITGYMYMYVCFDTVLTCINMGNNP